MSAKPIARREVRSGTTDVVENAAQHVIEDGEVMRLSAEDQTRLAHALLNPPEPNSALKQAMRRYMKSADRR